MTHILFCVQWLEMEEWLSIIGFVLLVSFSCLKPAKIFSIHNTSQWPYWKKELEEQMQVSHAMTKWLKSCWIRKWRMNKFWNYKTPIRTFPLVNTGWSVSMSTKHATWLRTGDSGCEIDIQMSWCLTLTGVLRRHFPLVCLANAIGMGMPLITAFLSTVIYVPESFPERIYYFPVAPEKV